MQIFKGNSIFSQKNELVKSTVKFGMVSPKHLWPESLGLLLHAIRFDLLRHILLLLLGATALEDFVIEMVREKLLNRPNFVNMDFFVQDRDVLLQGHSVLESYKGGMACLADAGAVSFVQGEIWKIMTLRFDAAVADYYAWRSGNMKGGSWRRDHCRVSG